MEADLVSRTFRPFSGLPPRRQCSLTKGIFVRREPANRHPLTDSTSPREVQENTMLDAVFLLLTAALLAATLWYAKRCENL